jgi:anti-sigma factor RsiW
MNDPTHDLERLISRCLDDECTPQQQRELNAWLQRDARAAALFEEHAALDREIKHALRTTLHRAPERPAVLPLWERTARVFVVAAAACLAIMFWFASPREPASPSTEASAQAGVQSWFASPPNAGDTLVDRPERFDRPVNWVGRPRTEWIVVPSGKPGEYLVIEVNRIPTRSTRVRQDF